MLGDVLEGWDWGWVGGRLKEEGLCIYLWLICAVEQQKPTQDCKAIIFQLKLKIKKINNFKFGLSSVQLLSHVRLFVTPWTAAPQASLSITNSWRYSNSCPLSQWCHPTISSSVVPLSFCLPSFPASWSLPMSQFFASGGQSIGVWASASVLPMNILISFRMDWFDLLALQGILQSSPAPATS